MGARKRILVFSASYGGGHQAGAEALSAYYQARYSDEIDVEVVDFFEEFVPNLNVLAKFAYQQSAEFFPTAYGTLSELVDSLPENPVVSELNNLGMQRVQAYLEKYDPDAVISTFPVAGGVVAELKGDSSFISAVSLLDLGATRAWLHPATDTHFVACKEVLEDLVVRGVAWNRIVVSGVPVDDRFAQDLSKLNSRKKFGLADRFTVLLNSAAGVAGDVKALIRTLASMGVQVVVVSDVAGRHHKRLESVQAESELVKVFGFSDEMPSMMKVGDVLIGKAEGRTVSEALAAQLPLVMCGQVPAQEIDNVDFVLNCGAGLLARDDNDVVEKIRFLSTHPRRLEQMAENAGLIGKAAAAQTICERVRATLM